MKPVQEQIPDWMPLVAFGSATLLHADSAPPWSLAVALIGIGWQFLHQRGHLALPGALWRAVVAVGLLLATATTYRSISGLAAGSTLLLVMGAAKLLEIRRARDARVIVLVSLALLMAAVLDRQALPRVPLYLACAWISLATLATLDSGAAARSVRRALGLAGATLLYALPLAALCFVLVPRLPGALWSVPPDASATTGLGDEMSPGSISELSSSDEVAFRVRFEGAPPPLAQRYWRGPVLHDFDGKTWRRSGRQQSIPQPVEPQSAPLRYRILQEPTGRSHLFGLDVVDSITGQRARKLFDGQVLAYRPVTSPIAYEGLSYLQVRAIGPLSVTGRKLDTQLPAERNPRSLTLAHQLRAAARDDRDYTRQLLRWFHDAGLAYTLSPPLLGIDSVDDLLFRTRLGFCGHFASAYVTLIRAAGIPARVVTGYLGGSWNAVGGYYTVRQSDAHAWAEVWLEGSGWVRIDPTSVVAPERLSHSLGEMLGDRASITNRMLIRAPWLRNLRDSWDAAANWWQERVVSYNLAAQLDLLRHFGLENIDYRGLALLLLGGAALWGVWVAWGLRSTTRDSADRLEQVWNRYAILLGKCGVPVAPSDAPRAVARRAARQHPAAAAEILRFSDRYLQLRFGPGTDIASASIAELQQHLRALARATTAARRGRTA